MDAHIAQRVNNISIYGEKKLRRRPSNHSEANGPSELNLFHWIGFKSYSFDNRLLVKHSVYIRLHTILISNIPMWSMGSIKLLDL